MASQPDAEPPKLLYPFYLDTDMSMAFSAALTGGVALEEEQLDRAAATSQAVKSLRGNLKLWRAGGFDAGRDQTDKDEANTESRLVRRHTVASIFIGLYDELRRTGQLVEEPDLAGAQVGDILSARMGPAVAPLRRIVDQLLRLLDLMSPVIGHEAATAPSQPSRQQRRAASRGSRQPSRGDNEGVEELEQLRRLLIALRDDLDHSGMIDIAVRVEGGTSAVLMLDKRFITPTALELIHTSSFTVVGRVTNIWRGPDEIVNLYRRSVLSLLPALAQSIVWAMFAFLGETTRALDPAAIEARARESVRGPSNESEADASHDDGEEAEVAAQSDPSARSDRANGEHPTDDSTADTGDEPNGPDDIVLGEDIAALNPAVEGPAIQILPLAICS